MAAVTAVLGSLQLLELAPDTVTVPLLGAAWGSVFGPSDFGVWLTPHPSSADPAGRRRERRLTVEENFQRGKGLAGLEAKAASDPGRGQPPSGQRFLPGPA
jgi:hypothetical protein